MEYSLIEIDGNAFSVMGYVLRSMKKEERSEEEMSNYKKEAMSGDYNKLLLISQHFIDELNNAISEGTA